MVYNIVIDLYVYGFVTGGKLEIPLCPFLLLGFWKGHSKIILSSIPPQKGKILILYYTYAVLDLLLRWGTS